MGEGDARIPLLSHIPLGTLESLQFLFPFLVFLIHFSLGPMWLLHNIYGGVCRVLTLYWTPERTAKWTDSDSMHSTALEDKRHT